MFSPPEEFYRKNAIVGGSKIIYIEINGFVGIVGLLGMKYSECGAV